MLKVFEERIRSQDEELGWDLDELAREGARRMLAVALELEVEAYLAKHVDFRDENGHALVVRNGRARPRKVTMGSGTVEVEAPRVHDRRPGEKFTSRNPAAVDEAEPEGRRGDPGAISAGSVDGRLPGGAAGAAG